MKKWRVISLLLGICIGLLEGVDGRAGEVVRLGMASGEVGRNWNLSEGRESHQPPLDIARNRGGKVLPLKEVRRRIAHRIRGRIIEIEFEYEDGRPVYEFKYIMPSGRVRELYVDARTGRVIKEEDDD